MPTEETTEETTEAQRKPMTKKEQRELQQKLSASYREYLSVQEEKTALTERENEICRQLFELSPKDSKGKNKSLDLPDGSSFTAIKRVNKSKEEGVEDTVCYHLRWSKQEGVMLKL
jgi:hypothetical protein